MADDLFAEMMWSYIHHVNWQNIDHNHQNG